MPAEKGKQLGDEDQRRFKKNWNVLTGQHTLSASSAAIVNFGSVISSFLPFYQQLTPYNQENAYHSFNCCFCLSPTRVYDVICML